MQWLGAPTGHPLDDVDVEWVEPDRGEIGLVAAHFATPKASSESTSSEPDGGVIQAKAALSSSVRDSAGWKPRPRFQSGRRRVEVTLIDSGADFVFGFAKLDVMLGRVEPQAVRNSYDRFDSSAFGSSTHESLHRPRWTSRVDRRRVSSPATTSSSR